MTRRVVITGLGAVTPCGVTVDSYYDAICQGKSGITAITSFDATDYASKVAGEVTDFNTEGVIDPKEAKRMDRTTQMAVVACQQAMDDCGLQVDGEERWRVGVNISSGIGGLITLTEQHKVLLERGPTRVSPLLIPMMIINITSR